ncbi:hypothetical protein ZEAMMB73_Zm00001d036313 [Zea mays]|uniref:Uncharacterized protein n=1 Tax=Zea mays TaxID=4577 RepID=A0A1D6LLR2_MAIZE|nr:hypothetical protein ZEAMMB73_Zm00001d036313 [Zea mays]
MLCSSHLLLRAQVNSCLRPPRPTPVPMARSAPTFVAVFLLVLVLLTMDAAQGQQPFPLSTDPSDADALHAVFRQWRLEGGAAMEDPCRKGVWSESSGINASVECNCLPSRVCRITSLCVFFTLTRNVSGHGNISAIPRELFNLTELVSL